MKITRHIKYVTLPTHVLAVLGLLCILVTDTVPVVLSQLWLVAVGWVLFAGIGTAMGHHRLFCHRSYSVSRPVEFLISLCSRFAAQGSTIFWKALHVGYHHPCSDTMADLHSPIHGRWIAYMGWLGTTEDRPLSLRGAADLLRSPWHCFVHRRYELLLWLPILAVALVSPLTCVLLFLIPAVLAQHQENLVNLFCHLGPESGGYRTADTDDNSRNRPILALVTWGEALHNSHHAAPREWAYDKQSWFEFDPCRLVVPLLTIGSKWNFEPKRLWLASVDKRVWYLLSGVAAVALGAGVGVLTAGLIFGGR